MPARLLTGVRSELHSSSADRGVSKGQCAAGGMRPCRAERAGASNCEGRAQRLRRASAKEGGRRVERGKKSKMLTYGPHPLVVDIESDIENGWVRRN